MNTITKFQILKSRLDIFKHMININVIDDCMVPFIEHGDILMIESVKGINLKVGDIIVALRDDKMVAHRIVKIIKVKNQIKYHAKGDSSYTIDSEVDINNILGIVKKIVSINYENRPKLYSKYNKWIALFSYLEGYFRNVANLKRSKKSLLYELAFLIKQRIVKKTWKV